MALSANFFLKGMFFRMARPQQIWLFSLLKLVVMMVLLSSQYDHGAAFMIIFRDYRSASLLPQILNAPTDDRSGRPLLSLIVEFRNAFCLSLYFPPSLPFFSSLPRAHRRLRN